jgi:hypothetical protein
MPNLGSKIPTKQATRSSLPSLLVSKQHTESSALHQLYYQGPLHRWSNFLRAVESADNNQRWSQRVIKYIERLDQEIFELGDEHGLQARFSQSLGSVLGHVFSAQSIDLKFADFKSLGISYTGIPDVILKDSSNKLQVVGELKAPWVEQHKMSAAMDNESMIRTLLAQPILYMLELKCKYGFLSSYDETIFLRQEKINGVWEIEYSTAINGITSYVQSDPTDLLGTPIVSVKQCFLYVGTLASGHGPVDNATPRPQWFRHRC